MIPRDRKLFRWIIHGGWDKFFDCICDLKNSFQRKVMPDCSFEKRRVAARLIFALKDKSNVCRKMLFLNIDMSVKDLSFTHLDAGLSKVNCFNLEGAVGHCISHIMI